ncbi:MAG: nitroreductase family protein [Thiobacillus sp.]|uniref:nitroreductase family protein n=1 Tax=Thiobacillus sp. TaxID=924 RepID=UPI002895796C|nr:nitroreductase family protein [Thiobacillus sp.]MDT3708330.1 nitroreductase family protein [Thiobacillus sp.]
MPSALLDAIQQRFSCREFVSGRPVTADELTLLREAGRLAPSAFGLEPWRFVTVTDEPQRAAVARACYDQPAAATAAAFIAIVALGAALDPDSDYVRARFESEARGGDTAPIYAAYRAHYRPETIAAWAQGQCNFAAAHMLLQAAHLGLGACPIGGFDAEALAATLALPPGETPTLLIALGHCGYAAPERLRKPLD